MTFDSTRISFVEYQDWQRRTGQDPHTWPEFSEWLRFVRDGGQCQQCGAYHGDAAPVPDHVPDHLAALHTGGLIKLVAYEIPDPADWTDREWGNYTTLCQPCLSRHMNAPVMVTDKKRKNKAARARQEQAERLLERWTRGR